MIRLQKVNWEDEVPQENIRAYAHMDASFAVNPNMWNRMGVDMNLGGGTKYRSSTQKS